MKKYIAIIFCLAVTLSCTKEADIKLPEQEEKLVVTSFISPSDTVLTAVVRTSSPKYNVRNMNNQPDVVVNAEVTITSDQGSASFQFDEVFRCYTLSPQSYPIYPGRKYTLSVKTPDGKQTSANTVVPADTLLIKHFDVTMNYSNDSTQLDINATGEIGAITGRPNYVAMFYRQIQIPGDTSSNLGYDPYQNRGYGIFEDDEKQPRSSFVFQERQGSYTGIDRKWFSQLYAEFWALNCSKEFYLYNRSVQLAATVGDNPFGDPVLVYTNMENGFGCFGAYMVSKRAVLR